MSKVYSLYSGVSCNVMSLKDYLKISNSNVEHLKPSTINLKFYDSSIRQPVGETIIKCIY